MYHYTESGLDNIVLKNGYTEIEEDGEMFISFINLHGLHKAIATSLAHRSAPLTGKEFRFLRIEMDMSQNSLGHWFGVSEQTIARWEKEQTEIPKTSDVSLRSLYLESIKHDSSVGPLLTLIAEAEGTIARLDMELELMDEHWRAETKIAA